MICGVLDRRVEVGLKRVDPGVSPHTFPCLSLLHLVSFLASTFLSFFKVISTFLLLKMDDVMEAAVLAVLSGAGYQETAREFRVSVSTLYRRVKNLFAVDHRGRPTVFTKFEEESFRKLIQGFESMNLPLTSTKFLQLVQTEASKQSKK